MKKNYFHRDDCRLCGSSRLELVLPILPSPIGDAFIPQDRLDEPQELFPLDTYICLDCSHIQNIDIVNPEILFRDYTYKTSASLGLVNHFNLYASAVIEKLRLPVDSFVVEMGSNDGSLLKAFKNLGMHVLGIDPAVSIAQAATEDGINTLPEFFSFDVAASIYEKEGAAQLFCANNVFAHIDNISNVVMGVRRLLASDGVFVFEVSYVPDMVDRFVFDTIYHEHVSHHSLLPLEKFLNGLDMTLFDVERVSTKGGSIRAFAQPLSTGIRQKTEDLTAMFENEALRGFNQPEVYRKFFKNIQKRKDDVLSYLASSDGEGKIIAAYGASTTTTTLLYHFELENKIKYIFDDNPIKHSLYSPRAHIPVLPSEDLYQIRPDIIIILAWQYESFIVEKHRKFVQEGGKFLIPLPELRIV